MNSTVGRVSMITIAAAAASAAIAAAIIGSRRRKNTAALHPLHGMISKRVSLFQRMADRSKCATCRPEASTDAVDGTGTSDYRLA